MNMLRFGVRSWWNENRVDIILIVILFIVAAIPRLFGLGAFLTADEKTWIGRGYEFVRAFKDVRFNDMLQTTHPGVTTLWVIGFAVFATMFLRHIPFSSQTLRYFVPTAQFPVAFLNALAVPGIYFLLRKLLPGRILPFFATLFIALDPFIVGYSRVAHVDALLMSFLTLAVLALIVWGKEGFKRSWLVASAVLGALAVLTKIPAIFLVPYFVLVVLVMRSQRFWKVVFLKERFRDLLEWSLIVGLLFVVIWPAIIFVPNPQGNVLVLKRDFVDATLIPHDMSEDYTLNAWHYPAALLTRTTPLTQLFALVAIGLLLAGKMRKKSFFGDVDERVVWLIFSYLFFFVVMMTLGAKKGDRYILPVWPAIDMLAALGLYGVLAFPIFKRFSLPRFSLFGSAGVVVSLVLLFSVASYHPYEISYSNPLWPDNLSQELGWGEGLDQVGAWLTAHDPQAVVASWYPEELGAFTLARVVHINAHQQNQVKYVVLYRNMFGRAPEHYANDFIDEYYNKWQPVFVAHIAGKEFAWVYEKRTFEQVVGEMTPGVVAGQEIPTHALPIAGVQIHTATYSGKATQGSLEVALVDGLNGSVLASAHVPVSSLKDTGTTDVFFGQDVRVSAPVVFVRVQAQGTAEGNAPSLRFTLKRDYVPGDFLLSRTGEVLPQDVKKGDLGVELLYRVPTGFATEEESKLLNRP